MSVKAILARNPQLPDMQAQQHPASLLKSAEAVKTHTSAEQQQPPQATSAKQPGQAAGAPGGISKAAKRRQRFRQNAENRLKAQLQAEVAEVSPVLETESNAGPCICSRMASCQKCMAVLHTACSAESIPGLSHCML